MITPTSIRLFDAGPVSGAWWTYALAALGALGTFALGFLFNELSTLRKQRREDQRAVGQALTELLEIRHQLTAVSRAMELLRAKAPVPIPAEADFYIGQFVREKLIDTGKLKERYDKAVSALSGPFPLLAYELRSKDLMTTLLKDLAPLAAADAQSRVLWAKVEDELVRSSMPLLNDLICRTAKLHGRETLKETNTALARASGPQEEAERFFERLFAIAANSMQSQQGSSGSAPIREPSRGVGTASEVKTLSKPMVYCDHNFVIVAHDAGAAYHEHLGELISTNRLRFALSTWHWLEMARDKDSARGFSVAAFADSLSSAWLFERLAIQRWEVEDAFFHSMGIQHTRASRLGGLAEVLADLTGADTQITGTYKDSRAFVSHMQSLGEKHPLNVSLRDNFDAQKQNGENYRSGKLTPEMLRCLDKILIRRFLPLTTPTGEKIDNSIKDKFLQSCKMDAFPSTAVEAALTIDGWQTGRTLNDRAFRDSQHVIALPYVDFFVTDDGPLTAAIQRVTGKLTFRTAEVITKAEFDKRFS
jgi:hypothetical protein